MINYFEKIKNNNVLIKTTVSSVFKNKDVSSQEKELNGDIPTYDYMTINVISKDKDLCSYTYKSILDNNSYIVNLIEGKIYLYESKLNKEKMFISNDFQSFFKDMMLKENAIIFE